MGPVVALLLLSAGSTTRLISQFTGCPWESSTLNRVKRYWTEEEHLQLISKINAYGLERVARDMGRTQAGIYLKIRKMDLPEINSQEVAGLLGITRRTARKWIRMGYLGPFRISSRRGKGRRKKRLIHRSNLHEIAGDPIYGWLLDRGELCEELLEDLINREEWYATPDEIAERCFLTKGAVIKWVREGTLPSLQTRYNTISGMPFRIIPRPLAEHQIESSLKGLRPQQFYKSNLEIAEKLRGFDNNVRAGWRDPWGEERKR